MIYELIRTVWALYFFVMGILTLNSISKFVFNASIEKLKKTALSLSFIPIWPLAIFSPEGREILLNKIEEL